VLKKNAKLSRGKATKGMRTKKKEREKEKGQIRKPKLCKQ
jgi:hypothetical protein